MSEQRRFAILMNPSSAGGKPLRLLPKVRTALAARGAALRVIETRDIAHAARAASGAVEEGDTVVALGGDGLVGAIAAALKGAAPLGVLPGGRGNDFARALGIPQDVTEACGILLDGSERTLDLGSANGRAFACIASTGYDSDANRAANETRFLRGDLVYAWGAIRALMRWKPVRFHVTLDGKEHSFVGYTVAAANTSYYGGGMKMAPAADPADGMLDVLFVLDAPKWRFLARLPRVFAGTHVELPEIATFRAREVVIQAERPFDVYADGDPITTLPATIRVTPGALRVIAPGA